jgi:hypothetical protein
MRSSLNGVLRNFDTAGEVRTYTIAGVSTPSSVPIRGKKAPTFRRSVTSPAVSILVMMGEQPR